MVLIKKGTLLPSQLLFQGPSHPWGPASGLGCPLVVRMQTEKTIQSLPHCIAPQTKASVTLSGAFFQLKKKILFLLTFLLIFSAENAAPKYKVPKVPFGKLHSETHGHFPEENHPFGKHQSYFCVLFFFSC